MQVRRDNYYMTRARYRTMVTASNPWDWTPARRRKEEPNERLTSPYYIALGKQREAQKESLRRAA